MRDDASDLCFKGRNSRVQFIDRQRVQAFARETVRGIAGSGRGIAIIHCVATSDGLRLLSTLSTTVFTRVAMGQQARQAGAGAMGDERTGIPQRMAAAGFAAPGGPEVLGIREVETPQPGVGQVLIRVAFAGVNRPDILQRKGLYPPPPGASPLPGLEISGTIVALGAGVAETMPDISLGARVCALVAGGGYAQYCLAEAGHCLPVPFGLTLAEAAALPETLFTVWHNVFERGWAKDGEWMLVHGGTSGIGTMAARLGRLFDMRVIVTCGGAEKCAAALAIGAGHAIDYKAQDFVAEVARITGGRGVDLVLDMVAGDYVARNLDCLAEDGRHVTIAVQGGTRATVNMAKVMQRRLTFTGSTLRPRSVQFKTLVAQELSANVWPMVESGELRPVMDRIFPLAEAARAHGWMESGAHIGKIVLEVAGDEGWD